MEPPETPETKSTSSISVASVAPAKVGVCASCFSTPKENDAARVPPPEKATPMAVVGSPREGGAAGRGAGLTLPALTGTLMGAFSMVTAQPHSAMQMQMQAMTEDRFRIPGARMHSGRTETHSSFSANL